MLLRDCGDVFQAGDIVHRCEPWIFTLRQADAQYIVLPVGTRFIRAPTRTQ